jgi:hypothetical protein
MAGAYLAGGDDASRHFFMEAAQTLPLLIDRPGTADILDAMKVHRIRLAKNQGLRAWEPVVRQNIAGMFLAKVYEN